MHRACRLFVFGCIWWCLPPAARAAPDPSGSAGAAQKTQVLTAQLRRSGWNMLWLPATVGNVKGSLIIDTGSPTTILSESKYGFLLKGDAHRLPAGAPTTTRVNSLKARVALTPDLRLGGRDLGALLVALVPERYLDEDKIYRDRASDFDGIMGEEFLKHYRAVIDCTRQLLYLNLGPPREDTLSRVLVPNGWTRVPMVEVEHHFVVPCAVNGFACRLIVDTGMPFTTLDETLLRTVKLRSNSLPLTMALIGNEGGSGSLVHLHTLQIGDYTATDVQMTAMERLSPLLRMDRQPKSDDPLIGVLGADTLGFNGAIIDLGGHALYLKHLPPGAKKP